MKIASGFWLLDRREQRLEVGLLRVVGREARDRHPGRLRRAGEVLRDAEAVRLLVVQHGDALDALALQERRVDRALVRVARRHAGVVALPARVVLLRLVTRARLGQAAVRVRGREQLQAAARSLVHHRDLDRGAARS